MKNTTLTAILLFTSLLCFSQQNKIHIDLRTDQFRLRFQNEYKIFDNYMYSFIIIRFNRSEYFKEIKIPIDNHVFIRPAVGLEYFYESGDIKPKLRLNLVGDYEKYTFRINYGSDFETSKVSTRVQYKITKQCYFGIQTSDELIGPRLDFKFKVFKNKNFKLGSYYLSKEKYGFSLGFDIFEFFPKLQKIKEKWEKKIIK